MRNKKLLVIVFNLVTLIVLLWRLTENLSIIDQVDFTANDNAELVSKAWLLKQTGTGINLIIGFTIGLLFLNAIVYRQWIRSKRWIIQPLLIFILSVSLSLGYFLNLTMDIGKKTEEIKVKNLVK